MGNHYEEEETPAQRKARKERREQARQEVLKFVEKWVDDVAKDYAHTSRGKLTLSYERLDHGQGTQILFHEEQYPKRFTLPNSGG